MQEGEEREEGGRKRVLHCFYKGGEILHSSKCTARQIKYVFDVPCYLTVNLIRYLTLS